MYLVRFLVICERLQAPKFEKKIDTSRHSISPLDSLLVFHFPTSFQFSTSTVRRSGSVRRGFSYSAGSELQKGSAQQAPSNRSASEHFDSKSVRQECEHQNKLWIWKTFIRVFSFSALSFFSLFSWNSLLFFPCEDFLFLFECFPFFPGILGVRQG